MCIRDSADIGDDADHDGGHHQRDGHKGHQHIADHAHDFGDRVHQSAHHIGILDHLILFALLPHGGVVGVQLVHHLRLGVKACLLYTSGRPEPADAPAFADVADPDTAKAAQWCVEQGLMKRRLNGKFAPGSSIPAYQVLNAYRKLAG